MATLAELKQKNQTQDQQVSHRPKTIFDFLSGDKKIEKAIGAVATQYLTPDRFLRLAVNAVKKTPLLMHCDPQSVLGAFMTSAALGLEPNTILQQAFLIPYKKRIKQGNEWVDAYECNFQIGARGFVTLAHRSPHIDTLQAEAIHEGDLFEHMMGSETFLKYRKALKDRRELIGAFCFTKMASGHEQATVLPLEELHKIRSRSETYNSLQGKVQEAKDGRDREKAEKKLAETPWVMWEDDMSAKSAIKKHSKQLPLQPGDAMVVASQLDGDDGKIIDMATMTDPDMVRAVMAEGTDVAEAVQREDGNVQMLEQNESPRIQTIRPVREAETVDARYTEHQNEPQQQQYEQTSGDAPETNPNELRARMSRIKDVDILDADADLISTCPPETQDALMEHYRTCREALVNPPATTNRAATRRPTQQMSIE